MPEKNDASHSNSHGRRKWSGAVSTDSTHPQAGLFNKDAETIARELASKRVSPKGKILAGKAREKGPGSKRVA